jgi:Uma2 family endonuclease
MGAPLEFPRRPLTVEDFHRMLEVGVLRPGERVELIEGELLAMAPIGGRHFNAVNRLNELLVTGVGLNAVVSVQGPVVLKPTSEPQPDLVLLHPKCRGRPALPGPEDVLLAIEVSDTTLRFDRTVKARLYARHSIPELWIIDVEGQLLLRHLGPSHEGYITVTEHRPPETVAAQFLPAACVELRAVFGPLRVGEG